MVARVALPGRLDVGHAGVPLRSRSFIESSGILRSTGHTRPWVYRLRHHLAVISNMSEDIG